MKALVKEHRVWTLLPFATVLAGLVAVHLFAGDGGASPLVYTVS